MGRDDARRQGCGGHPDRPGRGLGDGRVVTSASTTCKVERRSIAVDLQAAERPGGRAPRIGGRRPQLLRRSGLLSAIGRWGNKPMPPLNQSGRQPVAAGCCWRSAWSAACSKRSAGGRGHDRTVHARLTSPVNRQRQLVFVMARLLDPLGQTGPTGRGPTGSAGTRCWSCSSRTCAGATPQPSTCC